MCSRQLGWVDSDPTNKYAAVQGTRAGWGFHHLRVEAGGTRRFWPLVGPAWSSQRRVSGPYRIPPKVKSVSFPPLTLLSSPPASAPHSPPLYLPPRRHHLCVRHYSRERERERGGEIQICNWGCCDGVQTGHRHRLRLRSHRVRPRHRRGAEEEHGPDGDGQGEGLHLLRLRLGHLHRARCRRPALPPPQPAPPHGRQQVLLLRPLPPPRRLARLRPPPLPPLLADVSHSGGVPAGGVGEERLPHQVPQPVRERAPFLPDPAQGCLRRRRRLRLLHRHPLRVLLRFLRQGQGRRRPLREGVLRRHGRLPLDQIPKNTAINATTHPSHPSVLVGTVHGQF